MSSPSTTQTDRVQRLESPTVRVGGAETEGLICAFRLAPYQELKLGLAELAPQRDAPLWLHFNLFDLRGKRWIERSAGLDEDAAALLTGSENRVRLQMVPGGFAIVLGDLRYDFDADPEGFHILRVYVDEKLMITCRQQRLTSTDRLRHRLERGGVSESTAGVFVSLVEELVSAFARVSAELAETVDDAEDEILAGQLKHRAGELGRLRRLLARLRRYVGANRAALAPLPDRMGTLCDSDQRQSLREAIDQLDAVGQDLDLVTERERLLQEEIAGHLGEATNRNLYLLSIVTTVLLPITMITGVFGMNIGGLPFMKAEHGFGVVMSLMLLAVAGTMLFLRRMRVL